MLKEEVGNLVIWYITDTLCSIRFDQNPSETEFYKTLKKLNPRFMQNLFEKKYQLKVQVSYNK